MGSNTAPGRLAAGQEDAEAASLILAQPAQMQCAVLVPAADYLSDKDWVCAFEKPKGNPALFLRPATTVLRQARVHVQGAQLLSSSISEWGSFSVAGKGRRWPSCARQLLLLLSSTSCHSLKSPAAPTSSLAASAPACSTPSCSR